MICLSNGERARVCGKLLESINFNANPEQLEAQFKQFKPLEGTFLLSRVRLIDS